MAWLAEFGGIVFWFKMHCPVFCSVLLSVPSLLDWELCTLLSGCGCHGWKEKDPFQHLAFEHLGRHTPSWKTGIEGKGFFEILHTHTQNFLLSIRSQKLATLEHGIYIMNHVTEKMCNYVRAIPTKKRGIAHPRRQERSLDSETQAQLHWVFEKCQCLALCFSGPSQKAGGENWKIYR